MRRIVRALPDTAASCSIDVPWGIHLTDSSCDTKTRRRQQEGGRQSGLQ